MLQFLLKLVRFPDFSQNSYRVPHLTSLDTPGKNKLEWGAIFDGGWLRAHEKEVQMKKILGALVFVLVCELAGVIGSLATAPSVPGWYARLAKPSFNPPNSVFGPVWTILYALMGISAYLVYQKGWKRSDVRKALAVFAVQLVLNALWSIVFFGAHMILGGVVVIILLWAMILASIWLFSKISRAAAYLLIPYILWVSFATILNISLYVLNR